MSRKNSPAARKRRQAAAAARLAAAQPQRLPQDPSSPGSGEFTRYFVGYGDLRFVLVDESTSRPARHTERGTLDRHRLHTRRLIIKADDGTRWVPLSVLRHASSMLRHAFDPKGTPRWTPGVDPKYTLVQVMGTEVCRWSAATGCRTHRITEPCTDRSWAVTGEEISPTGEVTGGGVLAWAFDHTQAQTFRRQLAGCNYVNPHTLTVEQFVAG
jgi:hypothetical protein